MSNEFGLYEISVKGVVSLLSKVYISLIENEIPLKKYPSVMLWGPPGVGKSQGIKEIAEVIEQKTNKKVVVTDVRLLLFNPVDLRGIPTANEDKTLAVWLKPKIFKMDEDKGTVNILFLDEISSAPPSVQAAAYQITLDRMVGEHKLPDNCIVIAAGNRVTDKSVAYNMPKALANRLCHLQIKTDADSWHDWAIKSGVHPFVAGYLEYNRVMLMQFEASEAALSFPTPRSWEMVSNILNSTKEEFDGIYPMIVGCIGYDTAAKFRSWAMLYQNMPSMEKIFNGEKVGVPKASELHIVLRSAMVAYARENPIKELIDNSLDYACTLPWAFRKRLLHDYYQIDMLKPILQENEIFKAAIKEAKNDSGTD